MTNHDHDDSLSQATDRFERRLAEESGKQRAETAQLRLDVVKGDAEIRAEVAGLRLDMVEQFAASRLDMVERFAASRLDMDAQFAASRLDAEAKHRKLLKWALVFWAGHAAAVAGIVSAVGYFFARR